MNGIIFKEDTVKNLMDSYGVSNLEKLLIEVILGMDDQRDPVRVHCFTPIHGFNIILYI